MRKYSSLPAKILIGVAGIFNSQGCGNNCERGSGPNYSLGFNSPFVNIEFGGGSLCDLCILGGAMPIEGTYSISYSNETKGTVAVRDGRIFFSDNLSYELFRGSFNAKDTNLEGDPCTNCHCPSNGFVISGCFDTRKTFSGRIQDVNFCRVTSITTFSGRLIEDKNTD
ncbi:hypothetical protein HYV50_05375 [Candidatus Pacearchaeota archaeon]|nr:hypothetical protein [Candidatus Pacearchaeota archaeon]